MTIGKPSSLRGNYARLKAAQKPSPGAPIYSLLVNRPLGRMLAAVAHRLGMTPNQVTALSATFTFTGITLVALAAPGTLVAVAAFATLTIGYALDAADGQLARLRGGGSLTGEWLDHVIDALKTATVHLAVAVLFFRMDLDPLWLVVPLVFAATAVVHFFGTLLTELLSRNARLRLGESEPARGANRVMSVLKLPTDYGFLCLTFLLLAVPIVFQWTYLLLTLANVGHLVLILGVFYRRLRRLDETVAARENHPAQGVTPSP